MKKLSKRIIELAALVMTMCLVTIGFALLLGEPTQDFNLVILILVKATGLVILGMMFKVIGYLWVNNNGEFNLISKI